jgi:hypothetical protein
MAMVIVQTLLVSALARMDGLELTALLLLLTWWISMLKHSIREESSGNTSSLRIV